LGGRKLGVISRRLLSVSAGGGGVSFSFMSGGKRKRRVAMNLVKTPPPEFRGWRSGGVAESSSRQGGVHPWGAAFLVESNLVGQRSFRLLGSVNRRSGKDHPFCGTGF